MGWFSSRKKKNIENNEFPNEELIQEIKKLNKKSIKLNTQTERFNYIKDNCETITESNRQIEEAKVEYQAVTSYLTDMQRIDRIPIEERETIEDAARKIINLTKERNKFHQKEKVISDRQYSLFEGYESQIPKELPVMKDSENFQELIKKDVKSLENEKRKLFEEQKDIISKQSFLKGIAIAVSIIIVFLFIVFAVLATNAGTNTTLPFLLTVLMGMLLAYYLFKEGRINSSDIKLLQLKQNRQIMLMNKVKIKEVNNRNYLDYTYSKYMVKSYEQFKALWEEYIIIKDETKRYQTNTELLEFYQNELMGGLRKHSVADSEIWIYQPTAILDNKEMVEVRHRLNIRRQKLRERIDINTVQRQEAFKSINTIIKTYPSSQEDAFLIMKQYRIDPREEVIEMVEE